MTGTIRVVESTGRYAFCRFNDGTSAFCPARFVRELRLAAGDQVDVEVVENDKGFRVTACTRVIEEPSALAQEVPNAEVGDQP